MTDGELVTRCDLSIRTASPRRRRLADRGFLEEVGKKTNEGGRPATVWALVPEERIEEAAAAGKQRQPRRKDVHSLPLGRRLEMVRQLLDDPELNDAVLKQNGRAWRKVRGRSRDRKGQREHDRRQLNRQLKEEERDPSGLTDFLKAKRNLLDVTEAMRGTAEFVTEEMNIQRETGDARIPPGYWPEIQDLLEDLESMSTEARTAIDRVLGRLGADVVEGDAILIADFELIEETGAKST